METKYTDYLVSRGWTTNHFYDPEDDDHMASIDCGTVRLQGWGRDKVSADENLEVSCKEYVQEIEQALKLELVS